MNQPDNPFRQIGDTLTELGFALCAQGVLATLLQGKPLDQARTQLERRTTNELERLNRAARELTTITDGILEDRETNAEEPTQDPSCPAHGEHPHGVTTGRPGGPRVSDGGGS